MLSYKFQRRIDQLAGTPVAQPGDTFDGLLASLFQQGFGYRAVFVNGVRSIADDAPTGAASGQVLRA